MYIGPGVLLGDSCAGGRFFVVVFGAGEVFPRAALQQTRVCEASSINNKPREEDIYTASLGTWETHMDTNRRRRIT